MANYETQGVPSREQLQAGTSQSQPSAEPTPTDVAFAPTLASAPAASGSAATATPGTEAPSAPSASTSVALTPAGAVSAPNLASAPQVPAGIAAAPEAATALNLYELSQFVTFSQVGTLSHVAQQFHVSTPSVTRSMQHVEAAFGVPLFTRGKNKVELNETGNTAVEAARNLLQEAQRTVASVRDFDARQRTIVVRSCAPAPLWKLQQQLNTQQPNMMIASAICQNDEVLDAWQNGSCDIAILPFAFAGAKPLMHENLFVCVPNDHDLAKHAELSFADINGFNFLLRTNLGFWDTLCRKEMPASKFLVQTDDAVFNEIIRASSLPCFTTDYVHLEGSYPNRVNIPLIDAAAHVTFYAARR